MATIRTMSAMLLALLVQGCMSAAPRFDHHFGEAVRANLASQVAHPGAAANTNPAAGVDGKAARAAQERYERSFAQPEASSTPSLINISGR
jgi:type IV pilus biogenesis protein CpaD/CtpE